MLSLWSPFCTENKKLPAQQLFCCPVRARSLQLFYHCNFLVATARLALALVISYDLGHRTGTHTWRHTGAIVRYWYVYRVSRDAFRSFLKLYPSYALCYTYCCYAYHFYAYRLYFINLWHVYEWPKTYTWSGTFILKDGRYTFLLYSWKWPQLTWTLF
jgi:hypothetical protein